MDGVGIQACRDRAGSGGSGRGPLSALLGALLAGALLLALAGCGDDDPATATATAPAVATTVTTATTPPAAAPAPTETDPAVDDAPRELFGRVMVIKPAPDSDRQGSRYAGATILFVDTPQGRPHRILVPGDLALGDRAARVLRDPDCQGDVDARFSVVDTPPHEKLGDLLLVDVEISVAEC